MFFDSSAVGNYQCEMRSLYDIQEYQGIAPILSYVIVKVSRQLLFRTFVAINILQFSADAVGERSSGNYRYSV